MGLQRNETCFLHNGKSSLLWSPFEEEALGYKAWYCEHIQKSILQVYCQSCLHGTSASPQVLLMKGLKEALFCLQWQIVEPRWIGFCYRGVNAAAERLLMSVSVTGGRVWFSRGIHGPGAAAMGLRTCNQHPCGVHAQKMQAPQLNFSVVFLECEAVGVLSSCDPSSLPLSSRF
jgi:hypothetical protein